LKFKDIKLGYVKLSDGSVIILHVVVVDVRVCEEAPSFGAGFDIIAAGDIADYSPEDAIKEMMDKPTIEPRQSS